MEGAQDRERSQQWLLSDDPGDGPGSNERYSKLDLTVRSISVKENHPFADSKRPVPHFARGLELSA